MKYIIRVLIIFTQSVFAQDDLLSQIDSTAANAEVVAVFKAQKIVTLESTKFLGKKELYFVVARRFGSIKDGLGGLFDCHLKFL